MVGRGLGKDRDGCVKDVAATHAAHYFAGLAAPAAGLAAAPAAGLAAPPAAALAAPPAPPAADGADAAALAAAASASISSSVLRSERPMIFRIGSPKSVSTCETPSGSFRSRSTIFCPTSSGEMSSVKLCAGPGRSVSESVRHAACAAQRHAPAARSCRGRRGGLCGAWCSLCRPCAGLATHLHPQQTAAPQL